MRYLWLALGFLTSIPAPQAQFEPGDLGRAAPWFPVIGLLLGGLLYVFDFALGAMFRPFIPAILVVAIWAMLTGGLHLDGVADCGDGLFVAATREKRLDIMRDPHVGTFGVVALVLLLLLKVAAVSLLSDGRFLLLAPVLARWLLLPMAKQPAARPAGLGADFAETLSPLAIVLGALVPLALVFWLGWGGGRALLFAAGAGLLVLWLARTRLGGVSGDVLGFTIELTETAVLLAGGMLQFIWVN